MTTAFVLGGGGVLGAVEVGMLRALLERDLVPDLVLGTSVGALNGAMVARQPDLAVVDRLTELWAATALGREVYGGRRLHTVRRAVSTGTHIYSPTPLRARLEEEFGESRIEDLPVRFGVCAASIERAAEHWFESGPIVPAVLASAAVPRFDLVAHPTPDRAWVGDLTYIPTRSGWLFLAVQLDLATRRVVGWATGTTLATTLPLAALERALHARRPPPGLICHSDRGCQFASQAYRAVLAAHGCMQSMSRKGDCWDNAVAESFFATLEHELLADADFAGAREAHAAVAAFIDEWYNPERRHSTLGYVSPIAYEQQLRRADRAAKAA